MVICGCHNNQYRLYFVVDYCDNFCWDDDIFLVQVLDYKQAEVVVGFECRLVLILLLDFHIVVGFFQGIVG
jgi:hypothetical protein